MDCVVCLHNDNHQLDGNYTFFFWGGGGELAVKNHVISIEALIKQKNQANTVESHNDDVTDNFVRFFQLFPLIADPLYLQYSRNPLQFIQSKNTSGLFLREKKPIATCGYAQM